VRSRSRKFDAVFYALPFDDGVNGVGGNIQQRFKTAVWPANFHFAHHSAARKSEVQAQITGGNIAGICEAWRLEPLINTRFKN
jgi:hypothetical protein